jgi:hypothetical protein
MVAYVDNDVDTTLAHLLTGQNQRWANFYSIFSNHLHAQPTEYFLGQPRCILSWPAHVLYSFQGHNFLRPVQTLI